MTTITKDRGNRQIAFDPDRLKIYLENMATGIDLNGQLEPFIAKTTRFIEKQDTMDADTLNEYLVREAEGIISIQYPEFDKLAVNLTLAGLYKKASRNRSYDSRDKYGSFLGLVETLVSKGIYSEDLVTQYTKDELIEMGSFIAPERDLLFRQNGLTLLIDRYTKGDLEGNVYELPQERFLAISAFLHKDEKQEDRMEHIKNGYWALSNLYMTVATPTLANAATPYNQLSSCFISTVDDSLDGIYLDNWDSARVSKLGGGIGVYMGNVRSRGSSIRGVNGASGGVIG